MELKEVSVHYPSIVLSSETACNITLTTVYMQPPHGTCGIKWIHTIYTCWQMVARNAFRPVNIQYFH